MSNMFSIILNTTDDMYVRSISRFAYIVEIGLSVIIVPWEHTSTSTMFSIISDELFDVNTSGENIFV